MQKLAFGSKAETLQRLRSVIGRAHVPPLHLFTVGDWHARREAVLVEIAATLSAPLVVVRSSVLAEDSATESNAGAYRSITGIELVDRNALAAAVDKVIASYESDAAENHVFVQAQVEDVAVSGVLFTRDLNSLSPYYIVNYDDSSGATDSVTSGRQATLRTYLQARDSVHAAPDSRIASLIEAAKELERLFASDALDIEFAVDADGRVHVLQVRPIVREGKALCADDAVFSANLLRVFKKIQKLNGPHPGIHGRRAIYSVMTDWNPAEMIGIKPRPLSLSLYKELITDSTWAYQRNNYGYRDLRSFPLLISFLGFPYIDVRTSLNSFVPKSIDERLSGKLVDYYIERLAECPAAHDKVEFEIVFSCYYMNLAERVKKLGAHGFTDLEIDRIKFALLSLTNAIIHPQTGLYRGDFERLETLRKRYDEITTSDLALHDKIYWLLEDCKRYGTLPFAGLARAGFVAMQMLRSLVETEIISQEEMQAFMNSLNTVTRQLASDTEAYCRGELGEAGMKSRYGHLRPGTYDILSPRYDEAFSLYFGRAAAASAPHARAGFSFSAAQKSAIQRQLDDNGLRVTTDELLEFIKRGIEGREHGKFVFTRNLSQALVLLEQLGERWGFSKDDLSYLDIRTIMNLYSMLEAEDLPDAMAREILRNKRLYEATRGICLPQLITDERDVYSFHLSAVEPNFVTGGRVTKIVVLEGELSSQDLFEKIVLIRSADPGYDWLFSRNIAGLVTMYGGANSHMAIRCAELKIPAVIGCGEQNFQHWAKARMLDLDCANKQVKAIA